MLLVLAQRKQQRASWAGDYDGWAREVMRAFSGASYDVVHAHRCCFFSSITSRCYWEQLVGDNDENGGFDDDQ